MSRGEAIIAGLAAIIVMIAGPPARAHESRPLYIEIKEEADGGVMLRAVAPASVDGANLPAARLAPPCALTAERRRAERTLESEYRCATLAGAALTVDWPAFNPSVTTLVRATFKNGETRTAILPPDQTSWPLPQAQSFAGVARSYFIIGVRHIAFGIDHLLFLAGLLVIAGTFRRALVTATGFTIAHSLTLALVALDVITVSVQAVEATIALSIVFLAAEIARGDHSTLAWRRPALVASVFGLVHGAGFAAALAEIGLPQTEKAAALFFFNLGVEAGQAAIILAVFSFLYAVRRSPLPHFGMPIIKVPGAQENRSSPRMRGSRSVSVASGRPSHEHFWIPACAGMSGIREFCERKIVKSCVNRLALPQGRERGIQFLAYALGVVAAFWFIERAAAVFVA
jgi:hydrogenase/urease accessory protein HupE